MSSGLDQYRRLAEPFDHTFSDVRGGVAIDYITGEQCISRLNEVLGFDGWSFTVMQHGTNAEADEAWVLGVLEVRPGTVDSHGNPILVERQQFGSQKIKRGRQSGVPLDIGFDLKGAATDALKKCAMGVGVGLYLSKKEEQAARTPDAKSRTGAPVAESDGSGTHEAPDTLVCADCGAPLKETRFKDGTVWPPAQLAGYGRRKHNRVLCMDHYRTANEARQNA